MWVVRRCKSTKGQGPSSTPTLSFLQSNHTVELHNMMLSHTLSNFEPRQNLEKSTTNFVSGFTSRSPTRYYVNLSGLNQTYLVILLFSTVHVSVIRIGTDTIDTGTCQPKLNEISTIITMNDKYKSVSPIQNIQ